MDNPYVFWSLLIFIVGCTVVLIIGAIIWEIIRESCYGCLPTTIRDNYDERSLILLNRTRTIMC